MTSPTTIAPRVTAVRIAAASAAAAALLLLLGAGGCGSDGPTQPSGARPAPARRQEATTNPAADAPALRRRGRLFFDRSVSATLDERGGSVFLPAGGLLVVVPPGALDGPTTLTATALKGGLVAYELGPHGTRFKVPVEMYQDLDVTETPAPAELSRLEAGYFAGRGDLDQEGKRARIDEFVPTRVGTFGRTVRFEVSHFSGYVIATGRGEQQGGQE